jgi:hypothetical protein
MNSWWQWRCMLRPHRGRSSRQIASLCHAAHSRASWFRRGPSSAAVPAVCDQTPESGFFRRPKARLRADQSERRRVICRRARVVRQLELARPVRLQTMGAPDALNRTDAFAIRTPFEWVVSRGGSPSVSATTHSAASGAQRLNARGARPPNAGPGFAGLPHNLVRADAIGDQQHDRRLPSDTAGRCQEETC